MTKAKAYYQAYLVLDCLSKEEYSLIPKEMIRDIESKMEKDPEIKVDSTIPLEKQKIDEKAYDILDKVIKAIEKAYGKDAIDNPEKYAKLDEGAPKKVNVNQPVEIEVDDFTIPPPKKPQNNSNSKESISELKAENIKLHGIIEALEAENKKIDEAKELFLNYKEVMAQKDEKIRQLVAENSDLKRNNEELHQSIESMPKIVRKIFLKDVQRLLGEGKPN
ncbi:MAG: hypothetical protein IKI57_06590 [Clostridia bacterium]|nr:hypothetical protein [Clostridia bacterium]